MKWVWGDYSDLKHRREATARCTKVGGLALLEVKWRF
jgi:hypothetical protein